MQEYKKMTMVESTNDWYEKELEKETALNVQVYCDVDKGEVSFRYKDDTIQLLHIQAINVHGTGKRKTIEVIEGDGTKWVFVSKELM